MPTVDGDLTAAELAQLLAIVKAQAAVREQITQIAVAAATAPWRLFTGWWSSGEVNAVVRDILRIVLPLQRRMAQVTDAYLARQLTVMTGRTVPPIGAVDVAALRRALPPPAEPASPPRPPAQPATTPRTSGQPAATAGTSGQSRGYIDPGEAYRRIADSYRYNVVARGLSEQQAAARAVQRAAVVAETDVMLAMREQSRAALVTRRSQGMRISGYRRILHPELSKDGPCGLCVVAADRVYRVEHLLPIHGRCVCETVPIVNGVDPGIQLNRDDLNRIYAAAGGTTAGAALKKIRVAITEHGELGPVLVNADHNFRGPREVARMQVPDRATRALAQLESLEKSYEALLARAQRGEDVSRPLDWQEAKIAELRRELANA